MTVAALAGGVGAGKFLRGLLRVVPAEEVTVIVNTGDDVRIHGLHVSADIDSVTYWMAGVADRERGWGRSSETFRATEQLKAIGARDSWFGLGDLDLATHLFRTQLLDEGKTLAEATATIAARFGVTARILPMTNDRVATRLEVVDQEGQQSDLHFQEYWVQRGAADQVKSIRYEGSQAARPAEGVLDALYSADAVIFCPSNPVASIAPILSVRGIREAVSERRDRAAGVSPIVGGAPVRGMADKLLPAEGVEVTAAGVAEYYRGLLRGWVIDDVDAALSSRIERLGFDVVATPTMMVDDDAAASLAKTTLNLAMRS